MLRRSTDLFTSESVSDGHPDKICDQISDAILDACLTQDPSARVAVETAIKGHDLCLLGELTTTAEVDPAAIAQGVLCNIGHRDGQWGIDPNRMRILSAITTQAAEIAHGVDGDALGAGDQGLMFGYACAETPELMPLPITLAHRLMRAHKALRSTREGALIGPDAKAQVTIRYDRGRPVSADTVVLSTQHDPDLSLDRLRGMIREALIAPVIGPWLRPETRIHINPAGTFHEGGPVADAGLTGRKIIVDTYGGYARHGGGAFSGKDATKVDRSAAYAARQLARDVVSRGWADACEVQVAYAIGLPEPVSVRFDTIGGRAEPAVDRYRRLGIDVHDLLRPDRILERLALRRPCFRPAATFGHFGDPRHSWEQPLFNADVHERRRSRRFQQVDRQTATELAELRGLIADLRSDVLDEYSLERAMALAERHPRDCAEIEAEFDCVGRAGPRLHDLWEVGPRPAFSDVDAVRSALIAYVTSGGRLHPRDWAAFAECIGVNRPGELAPLILGGAIASDDEKRERLIAQINHAARDPAILARADAHLRALFSNEWARGGQRGATW